MSTAKWQNIAGSKKFFTSDELILGGFQPFGTNVAVRGGMAAAPARKALYATHSLVGFLLLVCLHCCGL